MNAVLETLQTTLEETNGLLPSEFTEEDLILLYELGYHLYQAEDFSKASELFQRLIVSKPFEPTYWQSYASSLQMQSRFREALDAWSMWCILEPNSPLPHFHAAEALLSLGEKEEGLKALTSAEKRDTTDSLKEKIEALRMAWGALC